MCKSQQWRFGTARHKLEKCCPVTGVEVLLNNVPEPVDDFVVVMVTTVILGVPSETECSTLSLLNSPAPQKNAVSHFMAKIFMLW